MPIPIPFILMGLGAAVMASADFDSPPVDRFEARVGTLAGLAPSSGPKLLLKAQAVDLDLPPQARAAALATKSTDANTLHTDDAWFNFGVWTPGWKKKMGKLYFRGTTGVRHRILKSKSHNLAWMARSKRSHYPKHGRTGQRVEMSALNKLIGRGALFKSFSGTAKDLVKEIPDIMASAGVVGAGVASGGASVSQDAGKQIEQVTSTIGDIWRAIKGGIKENRTRRKMADALIAGLAQVFLEELKAANPHAVKNGKLDLSASYKRHPRTFADLYESGDATPILYNPRRPR